MIFKELNETSIEYVNSISDIDNQNYIFITLLNIGNNFYNVNIAVIHSRTRHLNTNDEVGVFHKEIQKAIKAL